MIALPTGCGHPGIMNLPGFAKDRLAAPGLHGCYGGLHLSVFDCWKPEFDTIIGRVLDESEVRDRVGPGEALIRVERALLANVGGPISRFLMRLGL